MLLVGLKKISETVGPLVNFKRKFLFEWNIKREVVLRYGWCCKGNYWLLIDSGNIVRIKSCQRGGFNEERFAFGEWVEELENCLFELIILSISIDQSERINSSSMIYNWTIVICLFNFYQQVYVKLIRWHLCIKFD